MDDELIEGLVRYRKKEDISQKEMVRRLNAVEGTSPISKAGYTAIEQQRKGRKASRASVALLMRYFQSINNADMVLTLLRCIGTDPEALHQQLESAAWRRLPELPSNSKEQNVYQDVDIAYTDDGDRFIGVGWYNVKDMVWYQSRTVFEETLDPTSVEPVGVMENIVNVYAWKYRPQLPKPAPMLEVGLGGGDE